MEIQTLYLDLLPAYIPFVVATSKADGTKSSPTVDALIVYEEDGTDANEIVAADDIANSPFDPINLPTDAGKVGLWGINIAKADFTVGKFYIFLWEMTVDSITTHKTEVYFFCNASQLMANVTNLDASVATRSSHNAAAVWTAGSRELSTPNNYKADVTDMATNTNVDANHTTTDALITTVDGVVDTINGKTTNLPAAPASTGDVTTAHSATDGLITTVDGVVDDIEDKVDNTYDNTDTLITNSTDIQAAIAVVDGVVDEIPSETNSKTLNSTALASINAEADTALTDYDPPSRTEATADKVEIIANDDSNKTTVLAAVDDVGESRKVQEG